MNKIDKIIKEVAPNPTVYKVEHFEGDVGYWSVEHPVWQSGLYQESKDKFTCTPLYTIEEVEKMLELAIFKKENENVRNLRIKR